MTPWMCGQKRITAHRLFGTQTMADDEFNSLLITAGVLFAVLATTVFVYFRILAKPSTTLDWKSELSSTKASTTANGPQTDLKDVWEERRKRGVTVSSSAGKVSGGDKPFGSSYYYAHNNPDAIGGYKDGLRMEDYTMNQPRLLSKGGVPAELSEASTVDSSTTHDSSAAPDTQRKESVSVPVKRISKFLWDDPGDPNGIATIRIDTLPGSTLTETISWREANINDISITLFDNKKGLLIELTGAGNTRYRLQIPKLYGEVDEVRKLVKPNRLLVRLYKKKSWINPFDKTNLEAWPHP